MYINKKKNLPPKQLDKDYSMYVFVYYTNNRRFCLGYYDYEANLWMDSDGMVINEDFIWTFLPVKQMKAYLRSINPQDETVY
jgi:hypothetical protein